MQHKIASDDKTVMTEHDKHIKLKLNIAGFLALICAAIYAYDYMSTNFGGLIPALKINLTEKYPMFFWANQLITIACLGIHIYKCEIIFARSKKTGLVFFSSWRAVLFLSIFGCSLFIGALGYTTSSLTSLQNTARIIFPCIFLVYSLVLLMRSRAYVTYDTKL